MFELEVSSSPLETPLSSALRASFDDPEARVAAISLFSWEEHCTECAVPACYTTCALYEARPDGRCRRFMGGLQTARSPHVHQGYVVQARFKQWASLFAYANTHLVPIRRARAVEKMIYWLDRFVARLPDGRVSIARRRGPIKRLARRAKHALTRNGLMAGSANERPDYLLLEIVNPTERTAKLSLTVQLVQASSEPARRPYQQLLECASGMNRFKVPYSDIVAAVGDSRTLKVALTPNASPDTELLTLYFGTLAFVRDGAYERRRSDGPRESQEGKSVKLVVWDLDGTVWDGILIEDGPDNLRLRDGVRDVLEELDRRGILQSIVSKNDAEPVMQQLDRFGIREYFLFPNVSWNPKASAIASVIDAFNIGSDTVAFVDDSAFEREHVRRSHPDVRVYDAVEYRDLLGKPEFKPPKTADSSRRRYYYATEQKREAAHTSFDGDYLAFLRECEIQIEVAPAEMKHIDRMYELITRTNQLNFSGNVYSRDEVEHLIHEDRFDAYCVNCNDRFGEYGMIGFGLVDRPNNRLVDMAFSCRVQSKKVEHAFLVFLIHRYTDREAGGSFDAAYRRTERNAAAGAVFTDLGFELVAKGDNGSFLYRYGRGSPPTQDVVTVNWQGSEEVAG